MREFALVVILTIAGAMAGFVLGAAIGCNFFSVRCAIVTKAPVFYIPAEDYGNVF